MTNYTRYTPQHEALQFTGTNQSDIQTFLNGFSLGGPAPTLMQDLSGNYSIYGRIFDANGSTGGLYNAIALPVNGWLVVGHDTNGAYNGALLEFGNANGVCVLPSDQFAVFFPA